MFYRLLPIEQLQAFEAAIQSIIEIYGPGNVFAADNLIALDRHLGFGRDPAFSQAFEAEAQSVTDRSLVWRLHVLCWAGLHALHVPGDFIECGVYEGLSSAVLARFLGFEKLDKRLWLYDLFDHGGVSVGRQLPAHGEGLAARVAQRFAAYPNARVIPGLIPDSFAQGAPERIAWFHLDLNNATSETLALEHLFDRMSPGAVLILDDYGWKNFPGQKEAADRFAADRGHAILELPTGQGLLIKH